MLRILLFFVHRVFFFLSHSIEQLWLLHHFTTFGFVSFKMTDALKIEILMDYRNSHPFLFIPFSLNIQHHRADWMSFGIWKIFYDPFKAFTFDLNIERVCTFIFIWRQPKYPEIEILNIIHLINFAQCTLHIFECQLHNYKLAKLHRYIYHFASIQMCAAVEFISKWAPTTTTTT